MSIQSLRGKPAQRAKINKELQKLPGIESIPQNAVKIQLTQDSLCFIDALRTLYKRLPSELYQQIIGEYLYNGIMAWPLEPVTCQFVVLELEPVTDFGGNIHDKRLSDLMRHSRDELLHCSDLYDNSKLIDDVLCGNNGDVKYRFSLNWSSEQPPAIDHKLLSLNIDPQLKSDLITGNIALQIPHQQFCNNFCNNVLDFDTIRTSMYTIVQSRLTNLKVNDRVNFTQQLQDDYYLLPYAEFWTKYGVELQKCPIFSYNKEYIIYTQKGCPSFMDSFPDDIFDVNVGPVYKTVMTKANGAYMLQLTQKTLAIIPTCQFQRKPQGVLTLKNVDSSKKQICEIIVQTNQTDPRDLFIQHIRQLTTSFPAVCEAVEVAADLSLDQKFIRYVWAQSSDLLNQHLRRQRVQPMSFEAVVDEIVKCRTMFSLIEPIGVFCPLLFIMCRDFKYRNNLQLRDEILYYLLHHLQQIPRITYKILYSATESSTFDNKETQLIYIAYDDMTSAARLRAPRGSTEPTQADNRINGSRNEVSITELCDIQAIYCPYSKKYVIPMRACFAAAGQHSTTYLHKNTNIYQTVLRTCLRTKYDIPNHFNSDFYKDLVGIAQQLTAEKY